MFSSHCLAKLKGALRGPLLLLCLSTTSIYEIGRLVIADIADSDNGQVNDIVICNFNYLFTIDLCNANSL